MQYYTNITTFQTFLVPFPEAPSEITTTSHQNSSRAADPPVVTPLSPPVTAVGVPSALSSPDSVIPPPPPPGMGIPPPPPPPPGGGAPPPPPFGLGPAATFPPKPLVKPNVKVRPFFWTKVPNNLVRKYYIQAHFEEET